LIYRSKPLLKLRLFLFVALSLTLLAGCKPQDETVSPEGAKQILQLRGFEINAKGYFKAIQAEDLAAIRTFFQSGIDPNTTNEKGDTPLTYAVVCCEIKTVKALLEKVDINGRNKNGDTALYLALKNDRHEASTSCSKKALT
jgi:ankyrin repeat protein